MGARGDKHPSCPFLRGARGQECPSNGTIYFSNNFQFDGMKPMNLTLKSNNHHSLHWSYQNMRKRTSITSVRIFLTAISLDPLHLAMADFQKWGVSNDLKGIVLKNFSRGEASETQFFLASFALCFSPRNMNFVLTGLLSNEQWYKTIGTKPLLFLKLNSFIPSTKVSLMKDRFKKVLDVIHLTCKQQQILGPNFEKVDKTIS